MDERPALLLQGPLGGRNCPGWYVGDRRHQKGVASLQQFRPLVWLERTFYESIYPLGTLSIAASKLSREARSAGSIDASSYGWKPTLRHSSAQLYIVPLVITNSTLRML